MAVNYPAMREKVFSRYPFLRSTYFERRMLFDRGNRPLQVAKVSEFPFERATMVPRS
jgi:hypothetical protein